ncbi:MAG TPA: hypothetical protein VGD41_15225, partial [Pyrinomonadaceae bacterium]
ELILEAMDGKATTNNLIQITPARTRHETELILCRGCNRHVKTGTKVCPFCSGDIDILTKQYNKKLREAKRAYQRLLKLLPL